MLSIGQFARLIIVSVCLFVFRNNALVCQNTVQKSDSLRFTYLFEKIQSHSNPDSVIFYSEKLIEEAPPYSYWQHKGFLNLGNAQSEKGNFNEATRALFTAVESAQESNYSKGLCDAYYSLAAVYTLTKNYDQAFQYYDKALLASKAFKDADVIANIYHNKGSLYILLHTYDSALYFFNAALQIYQETKNIRGSAYSLGNIARINSELGNYAVAEEKLIRAIELLETIQDYYAISSFKIRLAKIAMFQNNIRKALDLGHDSYELALREGFLPQQRDASELLQNLYQNKGDFENAHKFQTLYFSARDSIINEKSIREMAELRAEFEVSQKQSEIDLLEKKRKVQLAVGVGMGSILLIALVFLSLLSVHLKRNRLLTDELAQQKQELQNQHDQLEELNKTKNRFFSIISHDLRGPIGILNGTTLLIREYLNSKNYQELEELTANMEYSVKKVQFLLDNLLEWAISQQNQFQYHPELIELNDLAYEVISVFEGMALAKNIELSYTCKFDKFYIIADRNSLMTILRNLVNNSLKFTHKNGQVHISALKQNDNVIISVIDNGVGIPESKLKNLFKIDQEKSTWGTDREKGLGIGLSLVHEFVTLNKGTIDVESEIGRGTKFTVKIPAETVVTEKAVKQQLV